MSEPVYTYDADVYCERCLPVPAGSDEVGCSECPEVDNPQHCAGCHRPLYYSLTTEGVDYVIECIAEKINSGDWMDTEPSLSDWYEGEPAWSVVYDWAKDLSLRHLAPRDQALVNAFVILCESTREKMQ